MIISTLCTFLKNKSVIGGNRCKRFDSYRIRVNLERNCNPKSHIHRNNILISFQAPGTQIIHSKVIWFPWICHFIFSKWQRWTNINVSFVKVTKCRINFLYFANFWNHKLINQHINVSIFIFLLLLFFSFSSLLKPNWIISFDSMNVRKTIFSFDVLLTVQTFRRNSHTDSPVLVHS